MQLHWGMTIALASMLAPPPTAAHASFPSAFGQRTLLTIDTEEEFDWEADFSRDKHGVSHVEKLAGFQNFLEELGVSPVYLIDWPILKSDRAVEIVKDAAQNGKAELGLQLHPWVNPPFTEWVNDHNSFAGNLPPELESEKLKRLLDFFMERLECPPIIYRAGRYGLSPHTVTFLSDAGIAADTSVRANYDYSAEGGPRYTRHPLQPYWVGETGQLLELPLTTVFSGLLREHGQSLAPLIGRIPYLGAICARSRLLERIPLTPEGVTIKEGIRGADIAMKDRLPIIVMSLHSSSLAIGHTPYVRNESELEALFDWLRAIYGHFARAGVYPTSVTDILRSVIR